MAPGSFLCVTTSIFEIKSRNFHLLVSTGMRYSFDSLLGHTLSLLEGDAQLESGEMTNILVQDL